jgi:hypothetical protein
MGTKTLEDPTGERHGRGADAGEDYHRGQGKIDQTVTLSIGHFPRTTLLRTNYASPLAKTTKLDLPRCRGARKRSRCVRGASECVTNTHLSRRLASSVWPDGGTTSIARYGSQGCESAASRARRQRPQHQRQRDGRPTSCAARPDHEGRRIGRLRASETEPDVQSLQLLAG